MAEMQTTIVERLERLDRAWRELSEATEGLEDEDLSLDQLTKLADAAREASLALTMRVVLAGGQLPGGDWDDEDDEDEEEDW